MSTPTPTAAGPLHRRRLQRITLENNLVYNTKTGSFHQHYGKENIVRNNLFIDSLLQQIQRSRAEAHLSFTFENNIVYYHAGKLLDGLWKDANVALKNNVYWNAAGAPITFAGISFEDWQKSGRTMDRSSPIQNLSIPPSWTFISNPTHPR